MRTPSALALTALLLTAMPASAAEDAVAEKARTAKVATAPGLDKPLKLTAELGTSLTRGNTETFHLHVDLKLEWIPADDWVSTSRFKGLYEEALTETTAQSWMVSERADRFVSGSLSLFLAAAVESDLFAGLARRYSGQLGVGYFVFDLKDPARDNLGTDKLQVELGAYGAVEQYGVPPSAPAGTVAADGTNIVAARAAARYVHTFAKGTDCGVEAEVIQDFIDTKNLVTSESVYVAAAVVDGVSVKLSAGHKYDAVPADPALKTSDYLMTGSIVATF